jgi:ADP-ribose pyrophosphatase YjhB (NUDIX family)
MKFCSQCGATVSLAVPEGDHLPRHICDDCGTIHYQNPKVVVGCLAEWEDRLLFCRRAIEPRYGFWTLPAGFMENGETVQEGAARETLEEARARVEVGALFTLFNLPHISQVYMLFRGRLLDLDVGPGAESLEVSLLAEHEVPWEQMAFPVIEESLRLYYQDRTNGGFHLHTGDIVRIDGPGRRWRTTLYEAAHP